MFLKKFRRNCNNQRFFAILEFTGIIIMLIGFLRIQIHIPVCESLKQKRSIVKKHTNYLRSNYNAGVSEIDDLDKWQLATIGVVTIGHSPDKVDTTLMSAVNYLEKGSDIMVTDFRIEHI